MPQKQLDDEQQTEKINKPLKSVLKVRSANAQDYHSKFDLVPKYRVRFNEALNTFFECDYVIYVDGDDDENENLYEDESAEEIQGSSEQVQVKEIVEDFEDQITLSPPEEYKDGLEDFCIEDTGFDVLGSEDRADHFSRDLGTTEAVDACTNSPKESGLSFQNRVKDEGKQLSGILKGGKLWRASSAEKTGVRFFAAEPSSSLRANDNTNAIYPTRATHSAFQQLFPRAKKLLQELPEKDIDYLTNNRYLRPTTADQTAIRQDKRSPVSEESAYLAHNLQLRYSLAWSHPLLREAEAHLPQRLTEPPATASLVEKLRWLTADVSDPLFPEEVKLESQKSPEDPSDAKDSCTSESGTNLSDATTSTVAAESEEKETTEVASTSSKSGKSSTEKSSKYRKLNDLFSRSRTKDKQKACKTSSSASSGDNKKSRVRSFSPPPPSELEPKMKVKEKRHIIHIISKKKELLGKLPNVVPVADHLYRAVDLVKDSQTSSGDNLPNNFQQEDPVNGGISEPDELLTSAQHDQNRSESLKKRYNNNPDSEDEAEDYGFLRRPSVRGIKTRSSSTSAKETQLTEPSALAPLQRLPGNIYGSTGNLYQHISGQQRPSVSDQVLQRNALERTASASFTMESSVYGTLSRQRPHMMIPQQRFERPTEISLAEALQSHPHRFVLPAPVASSMHVPNAAAAHRLPCSLPCYVPKTSYSATQESPGVRYLGYGSRPLIPVKPAGLGSCYRQVLPTAISVPVLRPVSAQQIQEEREGPEGSSSSPSLQSDVVM